MGGLYALWGGVGNVQQQQQQQQQPTNQPTTGTRERMS